MTRSKQSITLGQHCASLTVAGDPCLRPVKRGHKCAQHLSLDDGLRIAPSRLQNGGCGLFTTVARKKGERITPYMGVRVVLSKAAMAEYEPYGYGGEYVLQLSQTQFIDASLPTSCAGSFSNTARPWNIARKEYRGNNAHFTRDRKGRAWITATRTISAGEEVLTDYGRTFYINRCA